MKLRILVKELVFKTVEVDTDDFDIDTSTKEKEVFELAEVINEIKNEPQDFISQFNNGEVEEDVEFKSVTVNIVE
jgi:hypothetical protein